MPAKGLTTPRPHIVQDLVALDTGYGVNLVGVIDGVVAVGCLCVGQLCASLEMGEGGRGAGEGEGGRDISQVGLISDNFPTIQLYITM